MKTGILIFFLVFTAIQTYSQPRLTLNDSIALNADQFVGVDNFGALYYTQKNILYKKWNKQQWQFGDFILGELTTVSILNPLKILLFYEASNTIVLIDKYFNEIDRIDFNTIQNFKNISQVTPANDTQIWIFDTNTQQLEVFDTTQEKSIAVTQPLSRIPGSQSSNFNICWVLDTAYVSQFNIYGSLMERFKNDHFSSMQIYHKGLLLQKSNELFYWSSKTKEIAALELPEISIKQFYVTNEMIYIYDTKTLYSFNLTSQKI